MSLETTAQKVLAEIKTHPWHLKKETIKELEEALKEAPTVDKLDALATLWEQTGAKSISRRINLTFQYCAEELRWIIK